MRQITLDQLRADHGSGTERRVELYERFEQWLAVWQATGALRRLWVFGSFVSAKPGPGDIDILVQLASDFDLASAPEHLRPWLDHELCRTLHEMDLFVCKENTPDTVLALLLDTFGKDRSGEETIVEVLL